MWVLILSLVSVPFVLLALQYVAEKRDLHLFPPPGTLVSVGARNLHAIEQGSSLPAVVLESGLAASSLSWVLTQPSIAEFARVVSYDRGGLGWSDPGRTPLTLTSLIADLETLLQSLQLPTPVILVGHSFGGLLVRAFAHLHPERVAGLVLVDPVSLNTYAEPHPNVEKLLGVAVNLSRRGALMARFAVVRGVLWLALRGGRRLPALVGRLSSGRGNSVLKRLAAEISKLPSDTHAPISSHWCRPASFLLMADYLALLCQAAREAQVMTVRNEIPMIILSAASATPEELQERQGWLEGRAFGRHSQIPNTTHWLMLDRSDVVVDAVRELKLLVK